MFGWFIAVTLDQREQRWEDHSYSLIIVYRPGGAVTTNAGPPAQTLIQSRVGRRHGIWDSFGHVREHDPFRYSVQSTPLPSPCIWCSLSATKMDLPATLFIFGPEMVLVDCRLTDACVSFLPSFLAHTSHFTRQSRLTVIAITVVIVVGTSNRHKGCLFPGT
jgi:hypothetical protein